MLHHTPYKQRHGQRDREREGGAAANSDRSLGSGGKLGCARQEKRVKEAPEHCLSIV